MLPKFKMAARGQLTGDFFKVLLKFRMAAMNKLHIFLWEQKLKNLSQ